MKRISLVIALLLATQFIFAQSTSTSVSAKEAMQYGMYYFAAQYPTRANLQVKSYELLKSDVTGKDCYHVFNFENGGWTIISADKRGIPVLAYSDEDEFNFSESAPATQEWIKHYMHQLDVIEAKNIEVSEKNLESWNRTRSRANVREVPALITTKWNQDRPYNDSCPGRNIGTSNEEHTYTGCVATAMAQVMKYWNYPQKGIGSASYFWGDWITINFAETTYDWTNMKDSYGPISSAQSKAAVATLMYHCGVSINMDYGFDGSSSATEYTVDALRNNFGYRNGVNYKARDNGGSGEEFEHYYDNDTIWSRMLIEELNLNRPLIYSGRPSSGAGHAWVCDGYRYNEEGTLEFHMNWGWGGSSNGFYTIDNLQTHASAADASDYNFTYGQGAVFNIAIPDTTAEQSESAPFCMSTTNVFDVEHWDINDGSYSNLYKKHTNCDWLIKIDNYETDTIRYFFNYYELGSDSELRIYEGEDANGRLIKRFNDENQPSDSVWKHVGTPLYIKFVSGEEQAMGWELHYEAMRYPFTITTNIEGVGYNPKQHPATTVETPVMKNSTYTVVMKALEGYTVTEFVIDGVLKLKGSGQDTVMAYTFNNIKSNHTIDITFGPVSVEENNNDNISIFPNPNNGRFTVNFGDINAEAYMIYDMSGRVIEQKSLNGNNNAEFDMNIASGTYFLKVIANDNVSVKKIIIE